MSKQAEQLCMTLPYQKPYRIARNSINTKNIGIYLKKKFCLSFFVLCSLRFLSDISEQPNFQTKTQLSVLIKSKILF